MQEGKIPLYCFKKTSRCGINKKKRKSTVFVDLFAIKYKQQQIFYDHFHDHENAVPDEKYMFLKYYRFKNQNNFKNYFIPLLLNDNSRKKVFDALQI